jgi:uncharacterized Ntn-hydrolase superfamily protein
VTFSIVALDRATGDLGIALASKFLAAGSLTMFAEANVGAIASQAWANTSYGPDGLRLLRDGQDAQSTAHRLTSADDMREHRQLGVVDAAGLAVTYTGASCIEWAGGRTADGVCVQGNILAGEQVVAAMVDTYLAGGQPFPELLVSALAAADETGGDRRGRQAAALLVVREKGGYGGMDDRWIDLRIDDHPAPIAELGRLLKLSRLYRDRPTADELLAIDETLAAELRRLLQSVGHSPARAPASGSLLAASEAEGVTRIGQPQPLPAGWDAGWEATLGEWMAVENLEERMTASGLIDPEVLAFLRERSAAAHS